MHSSTDTFAGVKPRRATLSGLLAVMALLLGACTTAPPAPPTGATLSSEQIAAIVASPDRSAADRTNDLRRKPAQMLAFIGVRPGMVALDLSAGGGYTTELIARAVGPDRARLRPKRAARPGRARPPPPEGASPAAAMPRHAAAAPAERWPSARKTRRPRNIVAVVRPFEDPVPPEWHRTGSTS